MQEGEGNVRPQGPNFITVPCLHRDIVTSCSLPFGWPGAVLYRPSTGGLDLAGRCVAGRGRAAWLLHGECLLLGR